VIAESPVGSVHKHLLLHNRIFQENISVVVVVVVVVEPKEEAEAEAEAEKGRGGKGKEEPGICLLLHCSIFLC